MIKSLLVSVVVVVAAIGVALYYDHVTAFTGPVPNIQPQWWGKGPPRKDDTSVKPFKISFPQEVITDLNRRLNQTNVQKPFHPPYESIDGFQYGFNTKFLQQVLDFWRFKYSWKEREVFLNSLPQFTTEVQGLKIHFINAKPQPGKRQGLHVVPLLLLHGWPGSVREFYSIIPELTTPRDNMPFVFHVIAPSLPGYGFSQAAERPGLGSAEIAVLLHQFMKQVGFEKFVAQGGDWGSIIAQQMAQLYPESVQGLHINMGFTPLPSPGTMVKLMIGSYFPDYFFSKEEQKFVYPILERYSFLLEESGYFHLQATKPDTIGVALNDSPIGLAAYILEKFSTWTNPSWKTLPDGGLLKKYKLEDLLDNIMIYWLTNTATSSVRLYSEHFNKRQRALGLDSAPVNTFTGVARFPYELANQPRSILALKYKNIVQLSDFSTGGHFAAFEEPKLLAGDIWTFVFAVLYPREDASHRSNSK